LQSKKDGVTGVFKVCRASTRKAADRSAAAPAEAGRYSQGSAAALRSVAALVGTYRRYMA